MLGHASTLFGMAGFLGTLVFVIMLIAREIKKTPKGMPFAGLIVSVVLLSIGMALGIDIEDTTSSPYMVRFGYFLLSMGFFGILTFAIMLITRSAKKKPKGMSFAGLIVSIILFSVGAALAINIDPTDTPTPQTDDTVMRLTDELLPEEENDEERQADIPVQNIVAENSPEELAESTVPPTESPSVVLKQGDVNDNVKDLQAKLRDAGVYTGNIDGDFGSMTKSAVVKFQEQNNLNPDGIVNDETWRLLNSIESRPIATEPEVTTPETPPETPATIRSVWSYQAIYDEYSQKMRDATPVLIEEYKREAAENQGGLMGLADISNEKISKLADISTEGVGELADYYFNGGSGQYSEYEEWAGKLMGVYLEEGAKITDAYLDSAR